MSVSDDTDLYVVLGIDRSASQAEVKKAYHKAALSSHPDKVPEDQRVEADVHFKLISRAYEILYDDQKREIYDQYGLEAFQRGNQYEGPDIDMDDILAQMMGMNFGPGAANARARRPTKGKSETQEYPVTLEELYKGKTVKFANTRNVICTICKGSGGREKAKPKQCSSCSGSGFKQSLRSVGPGLVTRDVVTCGNCSGRGRVFETKQRCKKCHGECVVKSRHIVELNIPRGSRDGERLVLAGEGDQEPGLEPGDVVFILKQQQHPRFERKGANLQASIEISLAEALCGLDRVVIEHLDGSALYLKHPRKVQRALQPQEVLKLPRKGMPRRRGGTYGDLYIVIDVKFPPDEWLKQGQRREKIREMLPQAEVQQSTKGPVDRPVYSEDADIQDFLDSDETPVEEEYADAGYEDAGAKCQQQ